ncbi:MAG: nicotinate (nicotinamide) nucleotide adenylyltransferase [Clostridia bacterium]|nr:nicotinate (nicotinamide) nucleotide adenylyltransferase [Clostridia bacterium]
MEKIRIGIFGGTFNPVHREHVNLVNAAMEALNLTSVIVMPSAKTPGKNGKTLAPDADRLEMCRLAFDKPNIKVSSFEIDGGGVSYSYKTCEHYAKKYPFAEFYFIVGGDRVDDFHTWKNPERILRSAKLAACAREDDVKFLASVERFREKFGDKIVTFPYVGEKVSSTRARVLAGAGESVLDYVPDKVARYISEKLVYFHKSWADVKHFLKPERWQHTLRVSFMTAENCARIGWPEKDALTCSMLHDGAKYLSMSSPYLSGFKPPEGVPSSVMHQYTGAYLASSFFGVRSEKILNAIEYHTSGRPGMSPEETLIYLCDMLEEGRSYPGVEELRELFKEDMQKCLFAALKHQVDYLNKAGADIYPLTQEAYDYYKEIYDKEEKTE